MKRPGFIRGLLADALGATMLFAFLWGLLLIGEGLGVWG